MVRASPPPHIKTDTTQEQGPIPLLILNREKKLPTERNKPTERYKRKRKEGRKETLPSRAWIYVDREKKATRCVPRAPSLACGGLAAQHETCSDPGTPMDSVRVRQRPRPGQPPAAVARSAAPGSVQPARLAGRTRDGLATVEYMHR